MTDRPIIFSAPMVRAMLDGRKTQTRRLAWSTKPPKGYLVAGNETYRGATVWQNARAGDRLWVRENFRILFAGADAILKSFAVDEWKAVDRGALAGKLLTDKYGAEFRPSIHMPRWASRLTLIVTATKRERLQQISGDDAEAEGVFRHVDEHSVEKIFRSDRASSAILYFRELWTKLHGEASWDANPEVVALTFTVAKRNIDAAIDGSRAA